MRAHWVGEFVCDICGYPDPRKVIGRLMTDRARLQAENGRLRARTKSVGELLQAAGIFHFVARSIDDVIEVKPTGQVYLNKSPSREGLGRDDGLFNGVCMSEMILSCCEMPSAAQRALECAVHRGFCG